MVNRLTGFLDPVLSFVKLQESGGAREGDRRALCI